MNTSDTLFLIASTAPKEKGFSVGDIFCGCFRFIFLVVYLLILWPTQWLYYKVKDFVVNPPRFRLRTDLVHYSVVYAKTYTSAHATPPPAHTFIPCLDNETTRKSWYFGADRLIHRVWATEKPGFVLPGIEVKLEDHPEWTHVTIDGSSEIGVRLHKLHMLRPKSQGPATLPKNIDRIPLYDKLMEGRV